MRFWFRANLLAVLWLSSVTPVYGSVADVIGFTPDVGQAKDVAYDPVLKRAYVASIQFGLTVVDVADPNNPVPLGAAMPSFSGSAIAYSGNYAVVTQGTLGLTVVDIANPEAPLSIATVAGTFGAVAMFGRYAYVSQTVAGNPPSTLVVTVDLLDPRNPVIVGSLNLGAIAIGNLAVQGSYLYAAAGTGGLKILSLQNPAALSVAKTLTMTESALGVAVSGSSAFVTTNAKIYVVNIQTPTSATLKGSVATAGSRITAVGNKAYAISGLQLVTIDASNQNSPTLMNSQSSFSSQGIGVASGRLLLASAEVNATTHSGGLYIYDLPADIPDLVSNVYEGFGGDSIAVSGATALVTGGLLGARFVDVSDPFVPRIASSLAGSLGAAAIVGNIALLEETVSGNPPLTNLTVVNIGNLSAPQIVNRVPIGAYAIGNIALIPGFALVAAGSAGLLVFDISNPLIPILLRSLVLSGSAKWVTAGNDGYAYVAAGSAIEVVDIRNPAAPVSRASIPVSASALAASQGHLYAIVGLSLYAYNVTSPLSPQLDSIISDRGAQAVTTMGPLVILARPAVSHADVDQGVHVFDYTNPAAPVQIAQVIVPGSTRAVTISDGLVFAGDTASSVDVIEVNYSVPSTATPASTWTPTLTPTKSATFTPTLTPTRTPTFTPTFTATRTPTQSPTDTATAPPTATKTPTKTPTNTPSVASTATSSPTAIGGLAGAIRYQSSQKAVANASVMLLPGTSAAQTNVDGNFGFNGLPQSGWAVQPQRHDEPTCVTAGDAAQVLNAASFGTSLNAMQKLAADVTGNGTVTALDAALILERSVGNPAPFPVVDRCGSSWVFMPAAIQMPAQATATQPYFDSRTCRAGRIDYQPLQGSISGQDFVASAFGDVNGSWGGGLAFRAQTHGVRVGRPHRTGDRVRLPIYVDGIGSFRALQLRLKFNDQALQLDHIRRLGGARRALSAQRTEDGTIAFAIASSEWLDSGVVLVLELTARERLASFDFELTSAQVED